MYDIFMQQDLYISTRGSNGLGTSVLTKHYEGSNPSACTRILTGYIITSQGRLFNKETGREIIPTKGSHGYLEFTLSVNKKQFRR